MLRAKLLLILNELIMFVDNRGFDLNVAYHFVLIRLFSNQWQSLILDPKLIGYVLVMTEM